VWCPSTYNRARRLEEDAETDEGDDEESFESGGVEAEDNSGVDGVGLWGDSLDVAVTVGSERVELLFVSDSGFVESESDAE